MQEAAANGEDKASLELRKQNEDILKEQQKNLLIRQKELENQSEAIETENQKVLKAQQKNTNSWLRKNSNFRQRFMPPTRK